MRAFYASLFDLPTVPEIKLPKCQDKTDFEKMIVSQAKQASFFQSHDVLTQKHVHADCVGVACERAKTPILFRQLFSPSSFSVWISCFI